MIRSRPRVTAASVAGASVVAALLLLLAAPSGAWTPAPDGGAGGAAATEGEADGSGTTGAPLHRIDSLFPGDRPTATAAAADARPHTCPDPGQLVDHGGPVQTEPRVYVDFWDWTSDPGGERPYLLQFLSSVGGGRWLSTVTQYCASDDPRFGGQWSDLSGRPSRHPSDAQIQDEGRVAARHFDIPPRPGPADVNVQIIVALAPGVLLPPVDSEDCAYHEQLGKGRGLAGPFPVLTVLPYLPDPLYGTQCGASSVNPGPGGLLDGVSITEGHELAESITDPEASGWFDRQHPPEELGDRCEADQDYDIEAGGHTFAVQQLWSNAAGGCVVMADSPGAPGRSEPSGWTTTSTSRGHLPLDGGTPITAWTVTASPGTSSCTESGHTSCALAGLVNGTSYSVVVRAGNAAGMGPGSGVVSATPTGDQDCSYVGPYADLQGCRLTGAVWSGADLAGADLAGADLSGAALGHTDLRGADLAGADLDGAALAGTDLFGADLSGSTLVGAALTDCDLSAVDLSGADLSDLRLGDVSSSGITGTPELLPADWSLVEGYLIGPAADLDSADLSFADLTGVDLTGADLSDADLISADVSHADLSGADLEGANVSDADLRGADVSDTDLADLAGSIPYEFLCLARTNTHDGWYTCDNGL